MVQVPQVEVAAFRVILEAVVAFLAFREVAVAFQAFLVLEAEVVHPALEEAVVHPAYPVVLVEVEAFPVHQGVAAVEELHLDLLVAEVEEAVLLVYREELVVLERRFYRLFVFEFVTAHFLTEFLLNLFSTFHFQLLIRRTHF